jgi:uncharacterized protein YjiS (DUF1127 family)
MIVMQKSERTTRTSTPVRFLRAINHLILVARSRRALLRLDDHCLRDIGLTRLEAACESARAPWDPPLHWRCEKVDTFAPAATASRLNLRGYPPIFCA